MPKKTDGDAPNTWVYAYQIAPTQAADRLHPIATLLARENEVARSDGRIWAGKLVVEKQVTHIFVVSDSPELNLDGNLRLEAGLKELNTGFSITLPIAVSTDATQDLPADPATENDSSDSSSV